MSEEGCRVQTEAPEVLLSPIKVGMEASHEGDTLSLGMVGSLLRRKGQWCLEDL